MVKPLLLALIIALLLSSLTLPAFGKTHKDVFEVPCATLWPAVKDVLRNSGKYGIIGIDSQEMTASYNIGGTLGGKRINSLILNSQGEKCELQVQTAFSGLIHDDYGDLKKRVDESLAKQKTAGPPPPTTPTPTPKTEEPARYQSQNSIRLGRPMRSPFVSYFVTNLQTILVQHFP
jgi:hypothetical protein